MPLEPRIKLHKAVPTERWLALTVGVRKMFLVITSLLSNRVVRTVMMAAALTFCTIYFYTNYRAVEIKIFPHPSSVRHILTALLITLMLLFSGGLGWWLIIRGLGENAKLAPSLEAHLRSNVTKYIPGMIWQYLNKVGYGYEHYSTKKILASGLIIEMGLLIIAGLVVAIIFIPQDLRQASGQFAPLFVGLIFMVLCILVIFFLIPITIQKIFPGQKIYPVFFLLAILLYLVNWLGQGWVLWFLIQSTGIEATIQFLPLCVFSASISIIAGILFIFTPNGIGIRETVITFFLGGLLGGQVIVLVILYRLVMVCGDILSLGLFVFVKALNRR
jgi:hypothetical protein